MLSRHGSVALTRVYVLGVVISVGILWPARLQAQNAELWGVVKDAATGLPLLADVSIVHVEVPEVAFSHARTDRNGWYEARDIPSGRTVLIARAEGFGFSVKQVVLEPGQILGPIDFELEKAARLRGLVLDEAGLPLGGATVRIVYLSAPGVLFDWQTGETTTSATGEFHIRNITPTLDFYVEASHGEFPVHFSATSLRLALAEERLGVQVQLRRGVTLFGQVVDASGAPMSGVEVSLIAKQLHLPDPTGGKSRGLREETNRVTLTGSEGKFAFQGLGNGARLLIVRRPGYREYQQKLQLDRSVATTVSVAVSLLPETP